MWSKPILYRFQQPGENPLSPVPQGIPGFCPSRAWIGSTHTQTRRDTNFAIPGYLLSIAQLRVEGKRKFLVYINKVVIGGRLPADDDLIQICIKRLACCALRQREGDIRAEKVCVDGQVEAAALQLHQAPCDGQPQPAAFRVPRGIAAHEAPHQLVGGDIQLVPRDVLEADGNGPGTAWKPRRPVCWAGRTCRCWTPDCP